MTDSEPSTPTRRRITRIAIIAAIAVVAVAAGGVWYFFLRDDAPDAFSIDDATGALTDRDDDGDSEAAADQPDGPDPAEDLDPGDVSGTWTIDAAAAPDDAPLAAGFRVQEELSTIGSNTVVGRTSEVAGEVAIEGTTVTAVSIEVGMDSLATDDSRRDGRMRSALDTDRFPVATFALTEPIALDAVPEPGETITAVATGDMIIHGVTRTVDVTIEAQLVGSTLVIVGSLPVTFSDYDVQAPSAPIVLSVDDDGTIEFQLYLTRG